MIAHWNTVITEDVDLVICLLTLADNVLGLFYHLNPAWHDGLVQIFADFRILKIF